MGRKKDWALTRHMERAGLDMAALAVQSEVSAATLKRWKAGTRPSAKLQDQVYEALAEALRERLRPTYGARPVEDIVRELRETCEEQTSAPHPRPVPTEDPLTARLVACFPNTREANHELIRLLHALLEVWAKQHGSRYRRVEDRPDSGEGAVLEKREVGGLPGPIHFYLSRVPEKVPQSRTRTPVTVVLEQATSHDWGPAKILELLRACPPLFARYFPEEAGIVLPGYDGVPFSELTADYRRKTADISRHIQFIGLPAEVRKAKDARPDIPLARIFVPPVLTAWSSSHPARSVADLLHEDASTVILGDPGMGKTTLLTYLTLLFAEEGHSFGNYVPERPRLPLMVPIRDFERLRIEKEKYQKDPFTLLDYFDYRTKSDLLIQRSHWAFFDAAMRMGDAVLLVDGLDEAGSEGSRARLRDKIHGLRDEYPACPIWVTSRIHGYTRDVRLDGNRFSYGKLDRLTDLQIDMFIDHWYEIQISDNPRECSEAAASLRQAVRESRGVQLLAGNPLLLTLMAFVHRVVGTLPKDRGELYEQCVAMLLKSWTEHRRKHVTERHPFESLNLSVARQKDYLAHLALWAQERATKKGDDDESRALMPRKQALACVTKWHQRHSRRERSHLSEAEATDEMDHFLDYVCDAIGLLVDKGGGQLAFLHLSFQEYLAAFALECSANELKTDALFEHKLGEQAWEEVILLRAHIVLKKENEEENARLDGILDRLVARWPNLKESGRLTLVKFLRDDLRVAPRHAKSFLDFAVASFALEARFDGLWFQVLEQVARYGDNWRKVFQERLQALQARPIASALPALHLQAKLFGVPAESASVWASRWEEAPLDLCGFWGSDTLGTVVAERARATEWREVWEALDGSDAYKITLAPMCMLSRLPETALVGAAAWMGRQILMDIASRVTFATPGRCATDGAFLFKGGTLALKSSAHEMTAACAALRVPAGGRRVGTRAPKARSAQVPSLLRVRCADPAHVAELEAPWQRAVIERIDQELQHFGGHSHDHDQLRALARDFVCVFVRAFDQAFVRDFDHDFVQDFVRDFDDGFEGSFLERDLEDDERDLGDDFETSPGGTFVRGFINDFIGDFGRDFNYVFVRAFLGMFRRAFARGLGRDFRCEFARQFGLVLRRKFGDAYIRDFICEFVPNFESRLTSQRSDDSVLEDEQLWRTVEHAWYLDRAPAEIRTSARQRDATLKNPYALPFFLMDLWLVPVANHILAAARHATVGGGRNAYESFAAWPATHAAGVYTVTVAWEQQAKAFLERHRRLEGANGVLFVMHAAYAALFSGQSCEGSTWNELLAAADRSDSRIELAYLLNDICHFRASEETFDKVLRLLRDPPVGCRDLVEAMALTAGNSPMSSRT